MHPDEIAALFTQRGHFAYDGEGISQLQHAWQCGRLARAAAAPPALQLAAWLHDLGHLVTDLPGSPTLRGIDDAHEHRAARALTPIFGPSVAEPVALHVQAKRCLVSTQQSYRRRLSPDSIRSLALQGGAMGDDEVRDFMSLRGARDALRLRAWDDAAKDSSLHFASVETALNELRDLMRACAHALAEVGAAAGRPSH